MSTDTGTRRRFDLDIELPLGTRGLRALSVVGFFALWWGLVRSGLWGFDLIAGPVAVFDAFLRYLVGASLAELAAGEFGAVWPPEPMTSGGQLIYVHALYSLWRVVAGVGAATVLGVPLGVLVGASARWEDYLYPALEAIRPIPPVAWVPVSIVLFPTLSLTALSVNLAVVFVVFVGAFFPVLVNTVEGVKSIDDEYRQAAESLGADREQVFRHVVLPATVPSILTGIALAIGLGWITVVAAEIIAGNYGVGYVTYQAYRLLRTETILVGMITIGALGAASSALVTRVADRLAPWQQIETAR